MFDACIIELKQLIAGLDPAKIHELWQISSINRKSKHFIVLYDNSMHLCTCLILINRDPIFLQQCLFLQLQNFILGLYHNVGILMHQNSKLSTIPAISILSDNEYCIVEHVGELDFSHLESICGHYIFTKKFVKK